MTNDDPERLRYAGGTTRRSADGSKPQRLRSVAAGEVFGDDLEPEPGVGTAQENHAPRPEVDGDPPHEGEDHRGENDRGENDDRDGEARQPGE